MLDRVNSSYQDLRFQPTRHTRASGASFSNILAQKTGNTVQSDSEKSTLSLNNQGIQSLLGSQMTAQQTLLMICMMLGGGANSSSGSMSMILPLLTASADSSSSGQAELPSTPALNKGYLMQDRDSIAKANQNTEANIPSNSFKAVNPLFKNNENNRSAAMYTQVIRQFSVEDNYRYKVNKMGQNDTYCNIFMWDVTLAMGAEIPHYVDAKTDEPRAYPDIKGARELNANGIYDWLGKMGSKYGWVEVTAEQAQMMANQGKPAVTTWKNPNGHGHVQVVCPSNDGRYDSSRGVTVAQAGRTLKSYTPITSIYGPQRLSQIKYYAHV